MWKDFWLGIGNGPQLGNQEGLLVGKFSMDPGWEIWTKFWLENLEAPPSWGNRVEFWSEDMTVNCWEKLKKG